MAGRFNRFGCVVADALLFFKVGEYDPVSSEFGGDAAVEAAIDDAVDDIVQMMPEAMFQTLLDVQLEKVEQRASEGQTALQLGLFPLVEGKTHVWKGAPSLFRSKPRLSTDMLPDMVFTTPELVPLAELGPEAFTVDEATGVVTLQAGFELRANEQAFATYTVDVDSEDFSLASLLNLTAMGSAVKIGAKVYARGTSQWSYLDKLAEDYGSKISDLREGQWLPNEIRQMRFWQEQVPEADKKTSIQIGRLRRG